MSTEQKHTEPTSADLEAELAAIDADLDANVAALARWDDANAAGEQVDVGEKPKRRGLIELLRDRRVNSAARLLRAQKRERLQKLTALRAQIEEEEADDAEQIRGLGMAAMEAIRLFRERCDARDERLSAHQRTLMKMAVPTHQTDAIEPDPAHGGLACHGDGSLVVGSARLARVFAEQLLPRMIVADSAAAVEQIDRDLSHLRSVASHNPGDRYFAGANGGVIRHGVDGPSEAMRENLDLSREIDLELAHKIWWGLDAKRTQDTLSPPVREA